MENTAKKWAVVTGASSGLGVDFTKELALLGYSVVLVARRGDLLEKLSQELQQKHPNQRFEVFVADLGEASERQRLHGHTQSKGVEILINNAGFGLFGDFVQILWDKCNAMLQLDVVALTHLTHLYVADMVKAGKGRVMQIASTGAYQPTPTYAAYSAAKAYVLSFGVALNHELKGTGVSCTVVSPGVTATEFLQVSGQNITWYQKATRMDSPTVAKIGVRAMMNGRSSIVTGWVNAFMAWSTRFMPLNLSAVVSKALMKNA
jgi:hypothetical protein